MLSGFLKKSTMRFKKAAIIVYGRMRNFSLRTFRNDKQTKELLKLFPVIGYTIL